MCFPKHLGIARVAHPRYCTLLVNFGCSSATQGRRWKGANWPLVYNTGYKTHDLNCLLVLLSFLIFTSSHLAAIDLNVYLAQLSHIWLNCLMDMQFFLIQCWLMLLVDMMKIELPQCERVHGGIRSPPRWYIRAIQPVVEFGWLLATVLTRPGDFDWCILTWTLSLLMWDLRMRRDWRQNQ